MYKSINIKRINGVNDNYENYRGFVTLVVNLASHCAHTQQYAVLENIYRKYRSSKFTVLGFPCNQFGDQEPGTDAEISSFCSLNFGITFPLFSKIEVNGDSEHELYNHLKTSNPMNLQDTSVKWNFTKYLIDRNGEVLLRIQPPELPLRILERVIGVT